MSDRTRTASLLLLLALSVLACARAEAPGDRVADARPRAHQIAFEDGAESTVWITRQRSELVAPCPESVYQFSADAGSDPEWTRRNLELWDEAGLFGAVEQALRSSRAAMPGAPPDVCVVLAESPSGPVLELMGGIGGATVAPDLVVLYVAPSLNSDILRELPFTIAHEYHHAVTWAQWPTGLDVLLREGRAHHFAWLLYPDVLHPSARALSPDQVDPSWERIRPALESPAREFQDTFMFGGPWFGSVVPRWAGYTIGYCLVRAYADAHPELSPASLAAVPSAEFLARPPDCDAV